ncbi:RsiV family protein [uncultured Dysosmobacter sp.]|uniref:RsiV family protein n=1 Tax=uncultured Dysosmobacter sp. TaxID=2591384 RepID=UPI0026237771|nr:RsiV family protein [uncultured Dysosmobacter sp.]
MRVSLAELHTEPFTAEREWTVEGVPVLTAAVSVPRPEPLADAVSRRIHRYYQAQCRAYLRYCERCLLPQAEAEYRAALAASSPLPFFRAELGYRVTYNEGGFWSLYTQSREPALAGPPLLTRRGDTWDLTAGYPVPLADFFPPRSPWKRRLRELAVAEIQRREQAGAARYREGWRKSLRRSFNAQNYYLTAEGLVFFFPMYALAPPAEGIPAFTLPYGSQGLRAPAPPPTVHSQHS